MKVVTARAMSDLESMAYDDGCTAQQFTEQAGKGVAEVIHNFISLKNLKKNILLLCGKGNNGADTLIAGSHLIEKGYCVHAVQFEPLEKCSPLCKEGGFRFIKNKGLIFKQFPENFSNYSVLIDGIFGTGFTGEVKEPYTSLILSANKSLLPILSVDIPSGLNATTGEAGIATILATETFFLGLPKTGFFLNKGWDYVGKLVKVDFGLPHHYVTQLKPDFVLSTDEEMVKLLPRIIRTRHKYQAGLVVGLAGSPGMPGAALLSSFAALRGGCGMLRLLYPKGMESELSNSPYELIKIPYTSTDFEKIIRTLNKASAIFIGPGLGLGDEVKMLLKEIMPCIEKPLVVDADALTHYANDVYQMPKNAILTPHLGEMQRLLGLDKSLLLSLETIEKCRLYAKQKGITLILKGGPSFIFNQDEPVRINPTGDPGMATAGSGDVLTGLLASLLAQGLSPYDAASLGVYLHGLAGEYAAAQKTSYSMIASDIIDYFSDAWKHLQNLLELKR